MTDSRRPPLDRQDLLRHAMDTDGSDHPGTQKAPSLADLAPHSPTSTSSS